KSSGCTRGSPPIANGSPLSRHRSLRSSQDTDLLTLFLNTPEGTPLWKRPRLHLRNRRHTSNMALVLLKPTRRESPGSKVGAGPAMIARSSGYHVLVRARPRSSSFPAVVGLPDATIRIAVEVH